MKTKRTFLLILFLTSLHLGISQRFVIKSVDIEDLNYSYFFSNDKYHFFKNYSEDVVKIEKKDPNLKSNLNLQAEGDESIISLISFGEKILAVAAEYNMREKQSTTDPKKTYSTSFRYKLHLYLFDQDGKKIKKVSQKIDSKDSVEIDYDIDHDKSRIYIHQDSSVIQCYDFDLNENNEKKLPAETPSLSASTYEISATIQKLLEELNLNLNFSFSFNEKSSVDTFEFEHYAASYSKISKAIGLYEHYYNDLVIYAKKDTQYTKEIKLDIPSDKLVVELEYRILKNSNILIYGKYMENTKGSNAQYGMFSCVLDRNLNYVTKINFYELVRLNSDRSNLEDKPYTGFIVNKLTNDENSFHIDEPGSEEQFIYTYQHSFNNLVDHIYVLRVSETGELIVNYIGSRTKRAKKFYYEDSHAAFLVNNKIVFFFYDNPKNLNNKTTELECFVTEPNKKSNLLVSCTYDIGRDDFSDKVVVADRKSMKDAPNIKNADVYFDSSNSTNTAFFFGKNKKGKVKKLYMITFME